MKNISYSKFKNDILLRKLKYKGSVLDEKAVTLVLKLRPVPVYAF